MLLLFLTTILATLIALAVFLYLAATQGTVTVIVTDTSSTTSTTLSAQAPRVINARYTHC